MFFTHKLSWTDPVALARTIAYDYKQMVFLHSSMITESAGHYSYIAYQLKDEVIGSDLTVFADRLSTSASHRMENNWFGYLGYGVRHAVETLPSDKSSFIDLPDLCMSHYGRVIQFDHRTKTCLLFSDENQIDLPEVTLAPAEEMIQVTDIQSNMSKTEYIQKVKTILSAIKNGDLYQANLTRKFFGSLNHTPDAFELFIKLCTLSPSPYSAFFKYGEDAIISSSPELFLKLDAQGQVIAKPIKGTAPRYPHSQEKDQASYESLKQSQKDQAENLMIVDLMRNDLSRSSVPGSIKVSELFDITTYQTVYHMSSTIEAQKRSDISSLDLVKYCFPPGSMTGAPKIKAMQLCSELEQIERGIYSGALGWFGGDGSTHLSVVIRTMILRKNQFEFQVGGAIIADSEPENEWAETLIKAKALAQLLNLHPQQDLIL